MSVKFGGWKNSCLCLEDGIKPATNTVISLQSIYIICLEGEIMSNQNYYFDEEYLISELKRFNEETGKIPSTKNMSGKYLDYPSPQIFERLFGSFNNAKRKAGFECKTCSVEKGKKAERIIKNTVDMLEDTSRNNWFAPYDLICSKGYKVDVKGSSLLYPSIKRKWTTPILFWTFNTNKNVIVDYYICVGFDETFHKVNHVWIFKNDKTLKSKHCIHIQQNKLDQFKQFEWDLNKCNMDMKLGLYTY